MSTRVRLGLVGLSAVGALALGAVVISSSLSAAALTDQANLNLGADGIGSPHRFDIGVVTPKGTVEQAELPDGFDWTVAGSQKLVPGHSVSTTVPVFNNTPKLLADTTVAVELRNGDGSVGAGVPNITPFLRFTAEVDGTVLFDGVKWDEANGVIGELQARGDSPLQQDDAYTAGSAGSEKQLTLTIHYLDAAGVEDLNGGQSAISLTFHAESVTP